MIRKVEIIKNRFVDSVSLMSAAEKVKKLPGIALAELGMATPANTEILTGLGFEIPSSAGVNDLVIAISGEGEVTHAFEQALAILNRGGSREKDAVYHSIDEIDFKNDPYDLVQISLNGKYAAAEAKKALEKGMDVFIFSDNVPIEDELELKRFGTGKGLLVMGPDCGVGLVRGVCLGAGSIIKSGPVGIVGASGSGAQEIACIVEKCGSGLTSLIGTGGRDLYPQIGGIMMRAGMERLASDPNTKVIVLVSKLADITVMEKVLAEADKINKPVVAVFLGAGPSLFEKHTVHAAFSLEEAALKAVELAAQADPVAAGTAAFDRFNDVFFAEIGMAVSRLAPSQRYFRGLYCGGTFAEEALIYFSQNNPGVTIHSNLKNRHSVMLDDIQKSAGHTVLDLGAENFTKDAPHPVFNIERRLERFYREARDGQTAAVLLDFITGPGVHSDPIRPFAEACRKIRAERGNSIIFIASVCGSQGDPQNPRGAEALLRDSGVIVASSNYQSARLAGKVINYLEGRK